MIIDTLIDMQYALENGESVDMLATIRTIRGYAFSCGFDYILLAFSKNDNDKIRKALRKYLRENNYNRRYYKVIREVNWEISAKDKWDIFKKKSEIEKKLYKFFYDYYKDTDEYKAYIRECWERYKSVDVCVCDDDYEDWFKDSIFDGFCVEGVQDYLNKIYCKGFTFKRFVEESGFDEYFNSINEEGWWYVFERTEGYDAFSCGNVYINLKY